MVRLVGMNPVFFLLLVSCVIPVVVVAFIPFPNHATLQFLAVIHNKQHSILQDSSTRFSTVNRFDPSVGAAEPSPLGKRFEAYVSPDIILSACVCGASVLTFALNNFLSLGPIIASSAVGLIAAMILPEKFALAVLCGSFAGMARLSVVPGIRASVLLGALCAGTMALFDKQKWLIGVGGRLGFIAQISCTLQFLLSLLYSPSRGGAKLIGSYPPMGKLSSQLVPTCLVTVAGALFMNIWKDTLKGRAQKSRSENRVLCIILRLSTSVAAVSVTGLVASLFPVSLAGPAYCGSFIAMSSPITIETYGGLMGAALAGGVCQIALASVLLGGWGGKLGTASLIGVLAFQRMRKMLPDFQFE